MWIAIDDGEMMETVVSQIQQIYCLRVDVTDGLEKLHPSLCGRTVSHVWVGSRGGFSSLGL